jgi:hypothetical protein
MALTREARIALADLLSSPGVSSPELGADEEIAELDHAFSQDGRQCLSNFVFCSSSTAWTENFTKPYMSDISRT